MAEELLKDAIARLEPPAMRFTVTSTCSVPRVPIVLDDVLGAPW